MMKIGTILHDKSAAAASTRARFAIKSYSIADNYPRRWRSIVEDAKLDTLRNKQLVEDILNSQDKAVNIDDSSYKQSSFSSSCQDNDDSKEKFIEEQKKSCENIKLKLINSSDGSEHKTIEISADALPRLLSRAASIVGQQQQQVSNKFSLIQQEKEKEEGDIKCKAAAICRQMSMMSQQLVSIHFPKNIAELDYCNHLLIKYEPELDSRHPGYHDVAYRERRKCVAELAFEYKYGDELPKIEYLNSEIETWSYAYKKLKVSYAKYACKQHNDCLRELEERGVYSETKIPQLSTVSAYLQSKTGWQLRPTAGLLTARDFLASLAFKVFQTTQYVRHHGNPEHSVEPDCIHELMGHVPMLCDERFAQFSHEIGLASLGASDEQIEKLATLYWFTVEFGLCIDTKSSSCDDDNNNDNDDEDLSHSLDDKNKKNVSQYLKAYGAGLLSSFGEMEFALESQVPKLVQFDAEKTALQEYDDAEYQGTYFVAKNFDDVKAQLKKYVDKNLDRKYQLYYEPATNSVELIDSLGKLEIFSSKLSKQTALLELATQKLAKSFKF